MKSNELTLPEQYDILLQQKSAHISQLFLPFSMPPPTIYPSKKQHYRMRAEFRIWHQNNRIHYAMFDPADKKPYFLKQFPAASEAINQLMPVLEETLNQQTILKKKLFQVEFLSSQTGSVLVTLIYHRNLDEQWKAAASALQEKFNIHIIGRSRKQRIVLSKDFIYESFNVDGKKLIYRQYENSFSQPNAMMNEKMLTWVHGVTRSIAKKSDLVELYCGNGNFTCVMAANFHRVLATEIAKVSVKAARYNLAANQLNNVEIVRMSSEEFSSALKRERLFRRLSHLNLDDYNFSTIFVDPPRSGLDTNTLTLVQQFEQIIYISCNPETLKNNLEQLTQSHDVAQFAIFDQFPYTSHTECGVFLTKKC
ncbi:MAG: tRNA (uridine(54)-C5)-methyltransferase TrmA [Endozoicomonadaceae bacterium]|nr:tRNA (uridine(54)-C5)-methyltransferase TrmA [Endozoicomonadaceae bacterium]